MVSALESAVKSAFVAPKKGRFITAGVLSFEGCAQHLVRWECHLELHRPSVTRSILLRTSLMGALTCTLQILDSRAFGVGKALSKTVRELKPKMVCK